MEVKFEMPDKEIAKLCKAETQIAAKWIIQQYIKEHKEEFVAAMIDKATEDMVKRAVKETLVELMRTLRGVSTEPDLSELIGGRSDK